MTVAVPEPADRALTYATTPDSVAHHAATDLVRWAQAAEAAHGLAEALTRTNFVPEAYRGKPGEATAAILLGAEVGLSPLTALRSVYLVKGTPAMYTRALVALVLSQGHKVWTVSERDDAVTVAGQRKGSDKVEESTWTMARATAAGLAKSNPNYRSNPRAMLWARAAGDVARRVAPDVLLGIPEGSVEELGGALDEATTPSAPPSTTGTVRRRTVPKADPTPPSERYEPAPDVEGDDDPASVPAGDANDEPLAADEGEPEPESPPPADEPEPRMTPAQRARLHAEFNAAGMDRTAYIEWTRKTLDRDAITTTADLTVTEAGYLIDRIEAIKAARGPTTADDTAERHP